MCTVAYNQMSQLEREKALFSLAGPDQYNHRKKIYQFLLMHMSDEHKFQLTIKLCQEVLNQC